MKKKIDWNKLKKLPPMRRLFDRWVPESLTMIGVLKLLQFLRLLGVKATGNGWRKVTSIFLRGESSKFILGSFRLRPDSTAMLPAPNSQLAAERLAAKMASYLRMTDAIGYWVEPGKLAFVRRRRRFRDLVLAQVDSFGMLVGLKPLFDNSVLALEPEESPLLNEILELIVYQCNKLRDLPEQERALELLRTVKQSIRQRSRFNYFGRRRRLWLAQRILHATVLFCETMKSHDLDALTKERFEMPDFRKYRNPGFGMLGVVARFTPDYREVDLWCQFNHVAADGMPMQEFLTDLKKDWGSVGEVMYPPLNFDVWSGTQLRYAGEGNFRALFFEDFRPLLAVRAYLNKHYQADMGGSASIAGLVMWGLTRHEAFARQKILLPVDAGEEDGDRCLSLLMIRPRQFARRGHDPLKDFCAFQKEMNERMSLARSGAGAVSEFLELCALMHPLFYHLARRVWPRALDEVLGTAGLSILRDAEMFISPMTEFQSGGFIAIGNLAVPTLYGGAA
ncbi:MAG: hypothetical protein E7052_11515, partial [Lentisphaerae bacterium]|nr:hypothetical protein [Lentisphaerota bacterium]